MFLAVGGIQALSRLEEVFGQLLCNGGAATFLVACQHAVGHTEQGFRVDARVFGETLVLDADKGFGHIVRKLGIAHVGAVLDEIRAQQFAVGRDNLGGQVGARVLQFLEGGHGAEHAFRDAEEEQDHEEYKRSEDDPKVPYRVRFVGCGFLFIFHGIIVFLCTILCQKCLSAWARAWLAQSRSGRCLSAGTAGSR